MDKKLWIVLHLYFSFIETKSFNDTSLSTYYNSNVSKALFDEDIVSKSPLQGSIRIYLELLNSLKSLPRAYFTVN